MTNEICWYCGKKQAISTTDYLAPYVKVTYRPSHEFEKTLEPIIRYVPRCVDCARVHLHLEKVMDFNTLAILLIISGLIIAGIYSLFGLDFLDIGTCIPVVVILTILAVVVRKIYVNKYLLKRNTKKLHSSDSEYRQILPEEERGQYYMNPYTDLDDPLTPQQRKSNIGLKEIPSTKAKKESSPTVYNYANFGNVSDSVSTGKAMGELSNLQVSSEIMNAVYNDTEILKVNARAESLHKAVQELKTTTSSDWPYDKYLKYIETMPEIVRNELPFFSEAEWNEFSKEKRFEMRSMFLERTQEALDNTFHDVQEMIKEKMEEYI